jgi:hypothetical protein
MLCDRIRVSPFQPFQSRVGRGTVRALRFAYDRELIDRLKAALRFAEIATGLKNSAGWLKEYGCWFGELPAWPVVRRELAALGCDFDEAPDDTEIVAE